MVKQTPFYAIHEKAGAKLTDFGGWNMPVRYSGIKDEHRAVRNAVGLFDVSHMGEFFLSGAQAASALQQLTINDVSKLTPGKAQYTAMCYEDGGIVDDLIIYCLANDRFMVVVNAANIEKDRDWIQQHLPNGVMFEDQSPDMCLLAVQGPKSVSVVQQLTGAEAADIGFYSFKQVTFAGNKNSILSATGYTGEPGFEIYFNKNDATPADVWTSLMQAGAEAGIQPCGLGARDTLRLEMGYALYGNDITANTNPLEARMGWLTKLNKGEFIGREALQKIKEQGISRKLMGLVMDDARAIPRSGYAIVDDNDNQVGHITSGTRSITLNKNIAMGYLPVAMAAEGTAVNVKVRGKKASATVVKPPFLDKK